MSSTLCLDTVDSGLVTREQAFDRNLIPESTRTYQAISNEHLIRMIEKAAENQGLVLKNEQLGMARKGLQLFGVYDVEGMDFFENRISLSFGFYNSYDKSLTARFAAGARVFVCSNLCFNSYCDEETGLSTSIGHRHTSRSLKGDGLWNRLNQSLNMIEKFKDKQENFYKRMSATPLSLNEAHSLIVRAARFGAVNKTDILDIVDYYESQDRYPETEEEYERFHPEFKERTMYSLFNSVTEINKRKVEKNPVMGNIGTLKVTDFFEKEFVLN